FYGMHYRGKTYDTGSKLGFLVANLAYGLERPELRDALKQEIEALLAKG
ncbi:UTP--glucose-1-phosphate uridylyltransferase, partial [Methylobacterium sp. EM32]